MSLITEQAIHAFNNNENFKSGNSTVTVEENVTTLLLFHNSIATKDNKTKKSSVSACLWKTTTTRERLNGLRGVYIQSKKGVWYLNGKEWDGLRTEINIF